MRKLERKKLSCFVSACMWRSCVIGAEQVGCFGAVLLPQQGKRYAFAAQLLVDAAEVGGGVDVAGPGGGQ